MFVNLVFVIRNKEKGGLFMDLPTSFFGWLVFILEKYHASYLQGLITTLETSLLGTVLGCLLGFVIGLIQASKVQKRTNPVMKALIYGLKAIAKVYVTVFRGTPMMVQAMVIFYGLSQAWGVNMPAFQAAILIISLNTGSYMAETVRGGINSIDPGQVEGAEALGMGYVTLMYHIILPQTFKVIAPQLGNTFVANIKDTSVLNVISVTELYYVTQVAASTYFRMFESYTITALIYLTLTLLFNFIFKMIEAFLAGKESYEVIKPVAEVEAERSSSAA